jgi:uncharacterized protein YjbJ (UPF0337 family)
MNNDTVKGKFEQIAGRVKESFGEATGDQSTANAGAAEQVKGHAREAWGDTKDTVNDVTDSNRHAAETNTERAKETSQETGNDIRSKITSTAQNVKNTISEKLDEFEARHK